MRTLFKKTAQTKPSHIDVGDFTNDGGVMIARGWHPQKDRFCASGFDVIAYPVVQVRRKTHERYRCLYLDAFMNSARFLHTIHPEGERDLIYRSRAQPNSPAYKRAVEMQVSELCAGEGLGLIIPPISLIKKLADIWTPAVSEHLSGRDKAPLIWSCEGESWHANRVLLPSCVSFPSPIGDGTYHAKTIPVRLTPHV